ncbi:unnamed protein product, partial [Prorocentrum cordatum]
HESGSVRARLPQPPQALRRPRRASEGNSARARVRARPSCGVVGGAARGTLGGAPAPTTPNRLGAEIRRRVGKGHGRRASAGQRASVETSEARPHSEGDSARNRRPSRSNRIPRLPSRRLPTGAALRYARSSSPSRRVEKAITKNPAPSAATTKSARSTCLCTVGNSQLQHTCAPQGAGIVSNPTAPGAMLPQRRAQRC